MDSGSHNAWVLELKQWLQPMDFSYSEACGIFLDQGLNPCPLHWQADSYPLYCQGSPVINVLSLGIYLRTSVFPPTQWVFPILSLSQARHEKQ